VTELSSQVTSNEKTVRLWRRIFIAIYSTFTAAVVGLGYISIILFHCGERPRSQHGPQIGVHKDNSEELLACHRDLMRLLTDLHKEAFSLQARSLRLSMDPTAEWENWSSDWKLRWENIGWRCRLSDGESQKNNVIIEQMATIHGELENLQLSYSGLVHNFTEKYLARLQNLMHELSSLRAMIKTMNSHTAEILHEQTGAIR
jgi:hypothetical protein